MYLLSIKNFLKAILLVLTFSFLSISFISAQSTFRISKPIIGTNQICSSSSNYSNYLSYAFSSNVVNASGSSVLHTIELSNEDGLIMPRNIGYIYPNVNVVYSGSIDINTLNIPSGAGYKLRFYANSPTIYSDYSDSFSTLTSPQQPILNITGSTNLCSGTSQPLVITNPNNTYSYQWKNYSSDIPNANNSTYNATTTGSFSVKATSNNGCSATSNIVYINETFPIGARFQVNGYYVDNYGAFGYPTFMKSNQPYRISAVIDGGKRPYNFTFTDGATTTSETNINNSKDYLLTSPATGSKTYTITPITDACGSQVINPYNFKVRINDSKYCSVAATGRLGIKSFSIQGTSLNNLNSGRNVDGWGEFLNSVNINANVNYNFTISPVYQTFNNYFTIWADLNQNGIFDTNEKIFPSGINTSTQLISNSYTGIIKLPTTTINGSIRMRVILANEDERYGLSNYPCSSLRNGEIEDYTLNVFNGISPAIITTDSLPKNGVCQGVTFPVQFSTIGIQSSSNTNFRVETSISVDFSYGVSIIGNGVSSPINCNLPNSNYYTPLFIRVVPTGNIPNLIVNKAPNQITIRSKPDVQLFASTNNITNNYGLRKELSIANSTPISIFANVRNSDLPVQIELMDGRVFYQNSLANSIIKIDSSILVSTSSKFKIKKTIIDGCTFNNPDSVMIYVGNPQLRIMRVTRDYSDTLAISKLCGNFYLRFTGDFLDTLDSKVYDVQISDVNGNFNNPIDLGNTYTNSINSESQGGVYVYCSVPNSVPIGNNYRLRVIKKSANVISSIFTTAFEVTGNFASLTGSFAKNVINEGEIITLDATFSGGNPPYNLVLNSYNNGPYNQIYKTNNNSSSISIPMAPYFSQKYTIATYSACGSFYGSPQLLLHVRTQDKNNDQWYLKPIAIPGFLSHETKTQLSIIKSPDTLFRLPKDFYFYNRDVNDYFDYGSVELNSPITPVQIGQSYLMSLKVSNLAFQYITGIWIDKNQDGDFDDVGEELTRNSVNQSWIASQILNFTIPNNTNIGFSRLRIRFGAVNNTPLSDINPSDPITEGDTHDIPIAVLSNSVTSIISTPKISGNTLCNGNSFTVDFTKYGIPAGTSSSIELSDAYGNFPATPTVIGQGTTSSVNVTLPLTMTSGNYNIRVVSNGVTSPVSHSFNVTTNQLISMVNGDWHAGSTWSCGRVPTFLDATTVAGGTTVTVFSGDARVGSIITNGVLSFLNGTTLRFRTP